MKLEIETKFNVGDTVYFDGQNRTCSTLLYPEVTPRKGVISRIEFIREYAEEVPDDTEIRYWLNDEWVVYEQCAFRTLEELVATNANRFEQVAQKWASVTEQDVREGDNEEDEQCE